MSCHSEQCHHGSKEHLNKNVRQANFWQFSRSQVEMSIMDPGYWEQIDYTDSYDTLRISESYFEGYCRQDGDGVIVSVAIWQTIYAFCGSSSLDFDRFSIYRCWLVRFNYSKGNTSAKALWCTMSIMLVKAMFCVGDAAMISSQGAISKISFSFLKSAREKFQHLMDEGKSAQNHSKLL